MWQPPPFGCGDGSGALGAMLSTQIVPAGGTPILIDTTSITSFYTYYKIELINLLPGLSSPGHLYLQIHAANNWQTANYGAKGLDSNILISPPAGQGHPVSGFVKIYQPGSNTIVKSITGISNSYGTDNSYSGLVVGGFWGGTDPIDGFRIAYESGPLQSGMIKVYGFM